jgi:hypothetical protein
MKKQVWPGALNRSGAIRAETTVEKDSSDALISPNRTGTESGPLASISARISVQLYRLTRQRISSAECKPCGLLAVQCPSEGLRQSEDEKGDRCDAEHGGAGAWLKQKKKTPERNGHYAEKNIPATCLRDSPEAEHYSKEESEQCDDLMRISHLPGIFSQWRINRESRCVYQKPYSAEP